MSDSDLLAEIERFLAATQQPALSQVQKDGLPCDVLPQGPREILSANS